MSKWAHAPVAGANRFRKSAAVIDPANDPPEILFKSAIEEDNIEA